MDKKVSLFELNFCFVFLGIIMFLLKLVGIDIAVVFFLFIFLAILIMYVYILAFSWRNMPEGCMYNPIGFIEIHLENICCGSSKKFAKICSEIILFAVKERKNLMFDTGLVNDRRIKDLFGCSAEIYKPSIVQSTANFIFNRQYKNNNKRSNMRYIIYIDRLSEEQKNRIVDYLNRFLVS